MHETWGPFPNIVSYKGRAAVWDGAVTSLRLLPLVLDRETDWLACLGPLGVKEDSAVVLIFLKIMHRTIVMLECNPFIFLVPASFPTINVP